MSSSGFDKRTSEHRRWRKQEIRRRRGPGKRKGRKTGLWEREREMCIALEMENTREEKWAKGGQRQFLFEVRPC